MQSSSLSNHKLFCGPLFLVGMPRSGTKLLRGMLEQHSRIRFSPIETEFFPYWVAEWQRIGPKHEADSFERFFRECQRLPFFVQNAERGNEINCSEWRKRCRSFEPADVFEALIRTSLNLSDHDSACIWGDKSPSYIRHVPFLFAQFPRAKIIHIVRDVRDYALSIHEAWGKSRLRAAQRWHDDVTKCHADGVNFATNFLEVRYEDILDDSHNSILNICDFLGVEFNARMLTPGSSIERKMQEKDIDTVLSNNVGKYRTKMPLRLVKQIEKVTCSTLSEMGYSCDFSGPPARLPRWKMQLLQFADAVRVFRSKIASRGVIGAALFHLRYFRISGNRL